MNRMTCLVEPSVVVGVDTHKDVHVAVALDRLGARLDECAVPATGTGYVQLVEWALDFGQPVFGVEGTGCYGAGLARHLSEHGYKVIEVNRVDRSARRHNGKSDPLDAEAAARSVLSGASSTVPKSRTGVVEMIRMIKIARDTAVKSRSQAMITLKALAVAAPAELRESLQGLTDTKLIQRCASMRPGEVADVNASAKHSLRALARRLTELGAEISAHEHELDRLTREVAPKMVGAFGIGTETTATMLIAVGDNPERLRSEAAFAALCGVCPVPASSGKTSRHRLNRGGNRKANAALYQIVVVRLGRHQPAIEYAQRRTAEGKSKHEVVRCLRGYVAREVYGYLVDPEVRGCLTAA